MLPAQSYDSNLSACQSQELAQDRSGYIATVPAALSYGACCLQAEGSLWRALGVMASAGALRSAVLLLRKAGLPGAAVAFAQTCAVEGLSNPAAPADAGETLDRVSWLLKIPAALLNSVKTHCYICRFR